MRAATRGDVTDDPDSECRFCQTALPVRLAVLWLDLIVVLCRRPQAALPDRSNSCAGVGRRPANRVRSTADGTAGHDDAAAAQPGNATVAAHLCGEQLWPHACCGHMEARTRSHSMTDKQHY